MDTFDLLLKELKSIPEIDNAWDRLIPPFKGSFEEDQKRFLGIPDDERIAYVRIINADKTIPCSLAITNRGIYYRFINKFLFFTTDDFSDNIQFKNINKVIYSEREDAFIFSDGSKLPRRILVKKLDTCYRFKFAEILTNVVNQVLGVEDYLMKGNSLMIEKNYEAALVEINKALEMGSKDNDFIKSDRLADIYTLKGACLVNLDKDEEAKMNLIMAKEIASKSEFPGVRYSLIYINLCLSRVVDSRIESHKLIVEAFDIATDVDDKTTIIEELNLLHKSECFKSDFVSQDRLSERKIIIVVNDNTTPIYSKSLLCLERSVVKSLGISFPIGHPIEGCIYIAHPARNNHYIPVAMYEESLFLEKVGEFCYLLQCLGAKKIEIQKIAGKSLEEMDESKINMTISAEHKPFEMNANIDYHSQNNLKTNENYKFKNYMSFNPTENPYVPKDLNWLAIEPKWKRLIDNRLNGSLSHYIEKISTSENKLLSSAEEMSINLEIKALMTKFKGSLNIENIVSSSVDQSTIWHIEVIF